MNNTAKEDVLKVKVQKGKRGLIFLVNPDILNFTLPGKTLSAGQVSNM